MAPTNPNLADFYVKLMLGTAQGTAKTVCEANGIPLVPSRGSELRMIPVYEDGFSKTLLSLANDRAETTLTWPTTQANYLQAYWKRYRKADKRVKQDLVVIASNYCWARFYAAKELMHCFVEEDNYPASNTIELVKDLLEDLAAGGVTFHDECSPQTMLDEVAWLGALHYLIPQDWLPTLNQLHADITKAFPNADAYLHIAQILRVPVLALRTRMRAANRVKTG